MKLNKKMYKQKKGITLVALVITIVVLLILAGISIAQLTGNGLFKNAKLAKEKTQNEQIKENSTLENYGEIINEYLANSNREGKCEHISNDIEDFIPNVDFINGTYITISIPEIKTFNSVNIVGYAILLNDKVKALITEKTYTFENLEFNTSYNVSVIAIDDNAKLKYSKISAKTLNRLYLYKEGNECNFITGGWKHSGYHVNNTGTFTKNEDNIYLYAPMNARIFCSQTKPIDLTNYSKLYIEIEGTEKIYTISKISYFSNSFGEDISFNSMEPIDISNYNTNYYIHLTVANNYYCQIKNVWLEK